MRFSSIDPQTLGSRVDRRVGYSLRHVIEFPEKFPEKINGALLRTQSKPEEFALIDSFTLGQYLPLLLEQNGSIQAEHKVYRPQNSQGIHRNVSFGKSPANGRIIETLDIVTIECIRTLAKLGITETDRISQTNYANDTSNDYSLIATTSQIHRIGPEFYRTETFPLYRDGSRILSKR